MSARFTHAVVTLPALDLRPRPDHRAELASQLLLGEVVRLAGARRGGWLTVENEADGYRGWVREWGLVPAAAPRATRWRRLATGRIGAPLASVRTGPGEGASVSPVFFGGRVIAGRSRRGWRPVELPDGRRGWLAAADLRMPAERAPSLPGRLGTLWGTPYLWGGRTPAGYDCSALVQQVLAEQGIALPRDAEQQHRRCRALPAGEETREGDLAFFRAGRGPMAHVGIALGGAWFAHSRGTVRVNSMDPDNPMCDRDLLPQFQGWFRLIRGSRRG